MKQEYTKVVAEKVEWVGFTDEINLQILRETSFQNLNLFFQFSREDTEMVVVYFEHHLDEFKPPRLDKSGSKRGRISSGSFAEPPLKLCRDVSVLLQGPML